MSAVQRMPATDPLYTRPAPDRPFYATGMLLDANDFLDEQTYHRGRLAQAVAFLSGGGTLAGLRVVHQAPDAASDTAEQIRVEPGLAVDRLGRLIELSRPACLRVERWFEARVAADGGDAVRRATYPRAADNLPPLPSLLSPRANAEAGVDPAPPLPALALVADVYLRFIACERGLTPSFAEGPFDALDAVTTSRLRDAYELLLVLRGDLDVGRDGLPDLGRDLAGIADLAERRAALQDEVLEAFPASGRSGQEGGLAPLDEHPRDLDPSAVFLARVLIPVTADTIPQRQGAAVLVDNWSRRFVPGLRLLARFVAAA